MMKKYMPRITDSLLKETLEYMGAVLIVGPKWCGKTTTAEQIAKSVLKMQDPDKRKGYLATSETKPSLLLKGENPRLIDEWQVAPVLWDAVRSAVDERQEEGLFILTGSTMVDYSKIMHTGTGRIARLKMLTMSLFESNESNGSVSLKKLFDDPDYDIDGATSELSIEELVYCACRGGWPASIDKNEKYALNIAKSYLNDICEIEMSQTDGTKRNPQRVRAILKAYARNVSTLAKNTSILKDIQTNFTDMSEPTLYSYLNLLNQIFVIEDVPAWSPAIRSATVIRQGNKKEFTDPSIAVAALGTSPEELLMDLNTFGFIFETLCIRDLKAYSQADRGSVSYYHDRLGLEADCVLHLDNGKYALIEFKLGSREIEEGSQHLIKLRNLICEQNKKQGGYIREPSFLMVLTGGEMAYKRKDGVYIVPIGCLRD